MGAVCSESGETQIVFQNIYTQLLYVDLCYNVIMVKYYIRNLGMGFQLRTEEQQLDTFVPQLLMWMSLMCYLLFKRLYLKMDGIRMNLRTHRPLNYTRTENEGPDDYGYTKLSYGKEYYSPAYELNLTAKMLTKLINSANRRLKEKLRNEEKQERHGNSQNASAVAASSKELTASMPEKKNTTIKKEEPPKREREKKQNMHAEGYKRKQLAECSKVHPHANIKVGNAQDDKICDAAKIEMQQYKHSAGINKSAINQAILQQQSYVNSYPFTYSIINPERAKVRQQGQTATPVKSNKLFGRSSYHIAIAYNIHLQKKAQRVENGGETNIDPTFPAKKLKMQQQEQQNN